MKWKFLENSFFWAVLLSGCLTVAIAVAEEKYSIDQPLAAKSLDDGRTLNFPGKRGYKFEVISPVGRDPVVIRIYDTHGKQVQGNFSISESELEKITKQELSKGLEATASRAEKEKPPGCCDVDDPDKKAPSTPTVAEGPKIEKKPLNRAPAVVDDLPPPPRAKPEVKKAWAPKSTGNNICDMYESLVQKGVPREPLKQAMYYFARNQKINPERALTNLRYLSFADYSKDSTQERFFLIDLTNGDVKKEQVSHGRGLKRKGYPGDPFPKAKSKLVKCGGPESNMTRAGFFRVDDYYFSSNGRYSGWPMLKSGRNGIRMTGLTPNVNWQDRDFGVVMHEAPYNAVDEGEKMGRSAGCPAFRPGCAKPLLDKMQGGSLYYSYAPQCKDQMKHVYKQIDGWEDFCSRD